MIEERKSSMVYLSKADLQSIHATLSAKAKEDGDSIPPFSLANTFAGDFQDIKEELEIWIKEHIIDFEFKSYVIETNV